MKTSEEWAEKIITYLRENRVESLAGATLQIQQIVEWVQEDALKVAPPVEEIRIN